jgi:hypothetical protein
VRREREARPALDDVGQHADGDGGALDRIGADARLVEEDERPRARRLRDRGEVLGVPGERRQVALDRLLVADVDEDRGEERQPAALGGGHEQPSLRHGGREPETLERDGLAAGVGAR